jgi:hypothetical protein
MAAVSTQCTSSPSWAGMAGHVLKMLFVPQNCGSTRSYVGWLGLRSVGVLCLGAECMGCILRPRAGAVRSGWQRASGQRGQLELEPAFFDDETRPLGMLGTLRVVAMAPVLDYGFPQSYPGLLRNCSCTLFSPRFRSRSLTLCICGQACAAEQAYIGIGLH